MKIISITATALIVIAFAYIAYAAYSMRWSGRLLKPIKNGMSMSDVRTMIGIPIEEFDRGNCRLAWNYNKWYLTDAVVYFDKSGQVEAKEYD